MWETFFTNYTNLGNFWLNKGLNCHFSDLQIQEVKLGVYRKVDKYCFKIKFLCFKVRKYFNFVTFKIFRLYKVNAVFVLVPFWKLWEKKTLPFNHKNIKQIYEQSSFKASEIFWQLSPWQFRKLYSYKYVYHKVWILRHLRAV